MLGNSMAKSKFQPLEDWLLSIVNQEQAPTKSPQTSATQIAESWTILRKSSLHNKEEHHRQDLLASLEFLCSSKNSLFISEPQAKLLINVFIQNQNQQSQILSLTMSLLSVWIRKISKPSPSLKPLLESAAEIATKSSETAILVNISELILFLGCLTTSPMLSPDYKSRCCRRIAELLNYHREFIVSSLKVISKALAGAGYALSSCSDSVNFKSLLIPLVSLWSQSANHACVEHGLMLVHLTEWLLLNPISKDKMNVLAMEILNASKTGNCSLEFSSLMIAGGLLRCLVNRNRTDLEQWRSVAEEILITISAKVALSFGDRESVDGFYAHVLGRNARIDERMDVLLQCVLMTVSRCRGNVISDGNLLLCLVVSLLRHAFALRDIYSEHATISDGVISKFFSKVMFRESKGITRIICEKYSFASVDLKDFFCHLLWLFCNDLYASHRAFCAKSGLHHDHENLEMVSNRFGGAVFFSVAMFFSTVSKDIASLPDRSGFQEDASVIILDALSCVECFRKEHVADYSDMVKDAISNVSGNSAACASLARKIPPHKELVQCTGFPKHFLSQYCWYKDDTQTARVYFCLRILPPCMERIPEEEFAKQVAPLMYLYMQHPEKNVSRASHAVFAAFMANNLSSKTSDENTISLKEQLVVFYMERALEVYPHLTPFEGLTSGVRALVEHLPAGSPAIHFCVDSLLQKYKILYRNDFQQGTDKNSETEEESEPSKNLRILLLHLILMVDIQVLPDFLRHIAQLVIELPKSLSSVAISDLYTLISGSDDVVRKPVMVPWFQSLSFIRSQKDSAAMSKLDMKENSIITGELSGSVKELTDSYSSHSRL